MGLYAVEIRGVKVWKTASTLIHVINFIGDYYHFYMHLTLYLGQINKSRRHLLGGEPILLNTVP